MSDNPSVPKSNRSQRLTQRWRAARPRLFRLFGTSLRVQLSATTIFMAIMPMVIVAVVLGAVVISQTSQAMTNEAFAKLESIRTIKATEIQTYLTERRGDMTVLVDMVDALREEAFAKLEAVETIKKHQLETYFGTIEGQVTTLSQDRMIIQAMRDFKQSFHSLDEDLELDDAEVQRREAAVRNYYQTEFLTRLNPNLNTPASVDSYWPADVETHLAQHLYIADNPNPTGSKENLEDAGDDSPYSQYHSIYHPVIREYLREFGYYDIFLVDPDTGHIVYTVFKEVDYGTSLLTGPYKDTNFAEAFRAANAATDPNFVYLADFEPYHPSYNDQASFIASPIFDGDEKIGVLLFQMPVGRVNAIVQERTGLGETGETYLVGELDGETSYRSDRVVKTGEIGDPRSDPYTEKALAGESGTDLKIGSTGVVEIVSYAPLDIPDLKWGILTTIAVEEVVAPVAEGETQDVFTKYVEQYGYYDLFLIYGNGYVFYTVVHEPDYHTNMLYGPYSDTNLGQLVQHVMGTQQFGFADYEPYAPSNDDPASFIAQPIVREGEVELVVALQLPLDQISAIMNERTGLGESGETYLVGQDKLFRNDSRFLDQLGVETTILNADWPVDTVAARSALSGNSGTQIIDDYRGIPVLSSWSPVVVSEPDAKNPQGVVWALMAEVDEAEALATANTLRDYITWLALILVAAMAFVAALIGAWMANRLIRPVLKLTQSATVIAEGDFGVDLPTAGGSNEVGVLTNAFSTMVTRVREMIQSIRERSEELAERTRELEASQRVTFAASERVTPDELLDLVVNLIRDQFDLYHAQVYLVNEEQNAAVLKQSTGYAGRQLLTRRHQIPLDATSLVTKAIHTGEPVLVEDTAQDPNFMANPLLPETRAELVVPLKLKDEIIGVMDAQDRTPGRFSPSTISLFQSMADQVAILFENSELLEHITEQTESLTIFTNQLRTAAEIARRMGTILDPERLLEQTVEMLQSRFGLYHVHIYVLDKTNHRLVMRSGSGEVGRVLRKQGHSISLDAEKSLVARAARNEQSVLVNDTSLESDFMPNPLLPQTRSEVAIPLVYGDKVLGVLDIQDDQPDRFNQADVDTFGTLAGQIATALQTAALFEQIDALYGISRDLNTAKDKDEILQVLARPAVEAGCFQAAMMYIDPDETGEPEWMEVAALWQREGTPAFPVGSRFGIHEFPFSSLWMASPDEPQLIADLTTDERVDENLANLMIQIGGRALVTIPLTQAGRWIGILNFLWAEPHEFSEQEGEIYHTLASSAAPAVASRRLLLDIEDNLQETKMHLKVSQALAGAQTEEEVLDVLIGQMNIYLNTQPAIFMVVPGTEELTLAVRRHVNYECALDLLPEGMQLPISQFPTLQPSAEGKPFISSDLLTDESAGPASNELARQTGIRSVFSLPLMAGDQLLGIIGVSSPEAGYFDEQKLHLYRTLAEQGATALRIARLNDENIRTAERLREVDRLKSEFLASMSHELRTPLNSIIGYTEIMLMGLDTDLDPEMTEDVQAIYDNGQHLLRIINDVLDLAKIEAGRLELNKEEVPVEALVDAASSSITGLLVNKAEPVEFNVEIEENLPAIQGDQVRLNQVINNLASNAVKFTDEGHITLRAFRDDGWICLEVEDTGIGIAKEDLDKIFERFQQVDGSNARKQEGTGLGLAITRHLVQMHGGTIKVESELGKGSTFTVRLPVGRPGTDNAIDSPTEELPAAPKTEPVAKTKPVAQKVSTTPEAGAPEAGVALSPSDIVDMLLE